MPVDIFARPSAVEIQRSRMSVSVVVRVQCSRFSFPVLLQIAGAVQNDAARRARRNCPARTRCASLPLRQDAQKRHARALRRQRVVQVVAQVERRFRIVCPQQAQQALRDPVSVASTSSMVTTRRKRCLTPKCSSVCINSLRVRPVKSASSARFAQRSSVPR